MPKTIEQPKFVIAHFPNLDNIGIPEVGKTFERGEWPLHITMAPPVRATYSEVVEDKIKKICHETAPISTFTTEAKFYGDEKDILARQIELTEELLDMHKRLIDAVYSQGIVDLQYTVFGEGYDPHLSYSNYRSSLSLGVREGVNMVIGDIAIIATAGEDLPWTMVRSHELGKSNEVTT